MEIYDFNIINQVDVLKGLNAEEPDDYHETYNEARDYDESSPSETFFQQESSTLVSFFALQMIDIPKAFTKSKSLYSASAAVPRMRLINMLMRHGRKANVTKLYCNILHNISKTYLSNNKSTLEIND